MSRANRPFRPTACEQNANPVGPDLVARYARICADPLVWPLTAQVPATHGPSSLRRWFRRLVRPRG